jgi:serine protease Do
MGILKRTNHLFTAALALLLIFFYMTPASAQEAPAEKTDIRNLDKVFVEVAKSASERTVIVRNYLKYNPDRVGYGSGAVISEDGLVLTCSHVSSDADKLEVVFPDGRVFKARVLGENYKNDYSLLKIEAKGLSFFTIGSSAALKEGEWVMAFGHPGGPNGDLKCSASAGRVTAKEKRLPVQGFARYYIGAVQTDIPIFAGNSGGPLVNMKGELVGLNGAILLLNENSYAVAIDGVKSNLEALKNGAPVAGEGPEEGDFAALLKDAEDNFEGDELDRFLEKFAADFRTADAGKLGRKLFELYAEVAPDAETERAIRALARAMNPDGDISEMLDRILNARKEKEKNGDAAGGVKQVAELENSAESDNSSAAGKEMKPDAAEANPPVPDGASPPDNAAQSSGKIFLGVVVEPAGEDVRAVLGIEFGLVVKNVKSESPAESAGIRINDIILSIAGKDLKTETDLDDAIGALKAGEKAEGMILRRGNRRLVYLVPQPTPQTEGERK